MNYVYDEKMYLFTLIYAIDGMFFSELFDTLNFINLTKFALMKHCEIIQLVCTVNGQIIMICLFFMLKKKNFSDTKSLQASFKPISKKYPQDFFSYFKSISIHFMKRFKTNIYNSIFQLHLIQKNLKYALF